jgi:putative ATP-dependent endonuclease of the OLD family
LHKKLRPIKALTVDLGETTVFIGQNNAGKTAIIDAVRIVLTRRWGQRGTGSTENDVHRTDPYCDPCAQPPVTITLTMEESEPNEWDGDIRSSPPARARDTRASLDQRMVRPRLCVPKTQTRA